MGIAPQVLRQLEGWVHRHVQLDPGEEAGDFVGDAWLRALTALRKSGGSQEITTGYLYTTMKSMRADRWRRKPNPIPEVLLLRDRLARYSYPREIEFVDALPMTVTGKVIRKELKARAAREGKETT